MIALIVAACILVLLYLVGLIRVGAHLKYSESGLFLWAVLGPAKIQIIPSKPSEKKKEAKPKKSNRTSKNTLEKPKRSTKDTVSMVMEFLPVVGDAAGRFNRKIRIDRLFLHVIWGGENPAAAAQGYGAGHAVLGIIWPIVEHNFNVKDYELRVGVDFERDKPEIVAEVQSTLTVRQSVGMAVYLGLKVLKLYLGYRRENKSQKAVQV